MNRYLIGFVMAAGLTLGTASESSGQIVRYPGLNGAFFVNSGPPRIVGLPRVDAYTSLYNPPPSFYPPGALPNYGYASAPVVVAPSVYPAYAPRAYRGYRVRRFYGR